LRRTNRGSLSGPCQLWRRPFISLSMSTCHWDSRLGNASNPAWFVWMAARTCARMFGLCRSLVHGSMRPMIDSPCTHVYLRPNSSQPRSANQSGDRPTGRAGTKPDGWAETTPFAVSTISAIIPRNSPRAPRPVDAELVEYRVRARRMGCSAIDMYLRVRRHPVKQLSVSAAGVARAAYAAHACRAAALAGG
jgi:hypothetical protein